MFQNRYGNRLIRLITKIGFRLLTDNRFQNFSDYTTLLFSDIFCQKFPANLDGVISQNNKTGILMIMDTKIHSIGFLTLRYSQSNFKRIRSDFTNKLGISGCSLMRGGTLLRRRRRRIHISYIRPPYFTMENSLSYDNFCWFFATTAHQ